MADWRNYLYTPESFIKTLLLMQLDTIEPYKFPCAWSQVTLCRASVAAGSWDIARQGQDLEWGGW